MLLYQFINFLLLAVSVNYLYKIIVVMSWCPLGPS